ncbi:MAG TPA: class E sortase [Actinomycetota bacterium]|nr:class E sortase [Actinomycetota bacterium]
MCFKVDGVLRISSQAGRILARLLTLAAVLMMVGGVALIGHPFYTDYLARQTQAELSKQLHSASSRQAFEVGNVEEASAVTRLLIPKLNVDTIVVEGTSKEALDTGAGHYPMTPLPGQRGNVGIAGHRTTYGKPFADLDQLLPGDRVELQTPVGSFFYELIEPFDGHANPWVVEPDDWSVVAPTDDHMLTLTTCHPKRSDKQRLVARLKLVDSAPLSVDA